MVIDGLERPEQPQLLEVRFALIADDFLELSSERLRNGVVRFGVGAALGVIVLYGVFLVPQGLDLMTALAAGLNFVGPALVLIGFLMFWLLRWRLKRLAPGPPQMSGEQIFTIDREGVRSWMVDRQSSMAWQSFTSLRETKHHLYFYYKPDGFALVPKRAFQTPEAAQAFSRFAKEAWAQAKTANTA